MSKELADVHSIIIAVAQHYQYPIKSILLEQWLQTAINFVFDLIRHLFSWLTVLPGYSDTRELGNLIKTILYALGLSSTLVFFWLVASGLTKLSKQKRAKTAGLGELPQAYSGQDWRNQAQIYCLNKQWKEACRALLLSCLHLLDENKIVPFMATGTNFEYLRALAAYKRIRESFRSITDNVDLSWFGNKEANEEDFRFCLTKLEIIQSELQIISTTQPSASATKSA